MPINPDHLNQLTVLLSEDRLDTFLRLTRSKQAAIELHQATLHLNGSLMNVAATIEIALRNSVAENLGHYFRVANWLQQPPGSFRWREPELHKINSAVESAKRAEFAKLSQAEKARLEATVYPQGRPSGISHLQRAKERQRHLGISQGQVIAELTLFFWKRLYGPEYDQTLWRTTLKRTFPDKRLSRAMVATHLEQLYQSRNRLAHHEPVLHRRFDATMTAIEFISQRLGVSGPSADTPLATLLIEDIQDVRSKEAALRARLDGFRR